MLAGTSSNLLSTQGVNILINMYFGPALNAARAVAMQVYSAVNSFSQNFMTAVRPQIIKSYAQEDFRYMYRLVFTSSKLCFFLLFIISLPIILEADIILKIWLKNVPEFSVLFTRLVLIDLLIQVSFTPIAYVSQAADKTRGYQLSIATCFLAIFFISWGAYKVGLPVYATFIIAMIVDIIGLFVRLFILKKLVDFPIISYIKKVIVPILIVFLLSVGIITLIKLMVPETHVTVICVTLLGILIQCVFIWYIGLDASERNMTYSFVKSGLSKIRKK